LASDVKGEVEKENKILIIKRIHVTYHLKTKPENRQTVERAHGIHAGNCPVARTIRDCVEISTSLEIEEI